MRIALSPYVFLGISSVSALDIVSDFIVSWLNPLFEPPFMLAVFTSGCCFSISRLISSTHQMLVPRNSISQFDPAAIGFKLRMWLSKAGE